VFFAGGVWPGERGSFEIISLRGRMGYARLLTLTEASPQRIDPPCPHHGFDARSCGGCPWQFVSYEAQLEAKQQRVVKALSGICVPGNIVDIWPSPAALGYRNRAQLKSDGRRLGYVAGGSKVLAQVEDCLVLNQHNRETLRALREQLPNPAWKPAKGRQWTTLDLDDHIDASQVQLNERRPFRQGNSAQNARMREWLAEQIAALGSPSPTVELFAGSGNFSDILAATSGEVLALDSFRPAIDQLESKQLPGVRSLCRDLAKPDTPEEIASALESAKLMVLDPPRDGLKNIADYLRHSRQLKSIIYISCDSATLARDLRAASDAGFQLEHVQALDLFPQTPHVEVLTVATR
jgi:23S rRNA (uracil1939-C5)-methyltransferase